MRPREEIDVLQDILGSLEEAGRGSWGVVVYNNMNTVMWRKYRTWMLEAGLIREQRGLGRRSMIKIAPRGREMLSIISAYHSIWSPAPPQPELGHSPLRPWQEAALRYIWERGDEGVTSREVWGRALEVEPISRTSVINFLRRLTEAEVLDNEPRTGAGGIHGFYTPRIYGEFGPFLSEVFSKIRRARKNGRLILITP